MKFYIEQVESGHSQAKKVIRNKKGHERCLKIEIIFNLVERN